MSKHARLKLKMGSEFESLFTSDRLRRRAAKGIDAGAIPNCCFFLFVLLVTAPQLEQIGSGLVATRKLITLSLTTVSVATGKLLEIT